MDSLNTFQQFMLLIKALWHSPKAVGAVFPSSSALAKKMAAELDSLQTEGYIIEIGAGTGAITAKLLETGIPHQFFIIIEQSALLAQHLRERFPHLLIIEGDAADLKSLLSDIHLPIRAIISSLPLRSLPNAQVEKIMNEMYGLLDEQGRLIQYTYDFFSRSTKNYNKGFRLLKSSAVFLNIPPARVEVFQKLPHPSAD